MSKNIVIFSDGTGQDGGVRPEQLVSNIYKLYRGARVWFDNAAHPAQQVTFYDPGLGTDIGATAITAPGRFIQKLLASVEGRGIVHNIADCYEFIINHYEEGDRIFLFGFSRGAYTVRCVADLLRLCGIPTKTPNGQIVRFRASMRDIAEEATESVLEHGAGHPRGGELEQQRDELARRFRDKYGSQHSEDEQRSNVAPYFIGVFDTVAALGARGVPRALIQIGLYGGTALLAAAITFVPALLIAVTITPWVSLGVWPIAAIIVALAASAAAAMLRYRQRASIRKTIHDYPKLGESRSHFAEWKGENFNRLLSRFVVYARSANSIDENREGFDRVPWGPTRVMQASTAGHDTFKQVFFAGNHSDIGGSYPEVESRLSDIALAWMIEEAVSVPDGLKLGSVFVNGARIEGTAEEGPAIYLHPSDSGLQHDERLGTRDYLDRIRPLVLRRLLKSANYGIQIRELPADGIVR
jgi:uncharacterized protein (DUF2235 family)